MSGRDGRGSGRRSGASKSPSLSSSLEAGGSAFPRRALRSRAARRRAAEGTARLRRVVGKEVERQSVELFGHLGERHMARIRPLEDVKGASRDSLLDLAPIARGDLAVHLARADEAGCLNLVQ